MHLFIFKEIPKGSNVVIYGYGSVGKDFILQIDRTHWCNIVCVVNRDYQKVSCAKEHVCSPEQLKSLLNYEYLIIAIDSIAIAEDVAQYIVNDLDVDKEKIIFCHNREIKDNKNEIICWIMK